MSGSRILSLGHYQPTKVLTNDDLAQLAAERYADMVRSAPRLWVISPDVLTCESHKFSLAVSGQRHLLVDQAGGPHRLCPDVGSPESE